MVEDVQRFARVVGAGGDCLHDDSLVFYVLFGLTGSLSPFGLCCIVLGGALEFFAGKGGLRGLEFDESIAGLTGVQDRGFFSLLKLLLLTLLSVAAGRLHRISCRIDDGTFRVRELMI